jgi:hypothetical protein
MTMNTPDPELRRLVDGWYDGTLAPEHTAQLELRLRGDAQAKAYFLGMAVLEAALPMATAAMANPASRRLAWRRWVRVGQMAALFVLGVGLGAWGWQQIAHPAAAPLNRTAQARITGMLGVTWPESGANHPVEFHADAGSASIESGLIELTFATGTRAVIEGPALFRVTGENALLLDHGKLVAEVPKGAEGFRVAYAAGEIVDLGTEFALEVPQSAGPAHVGVFRGEIEYHSKAGNRVVKLTENHAVEASPGALVSVPFDHARFTRDIPSREFSWELKGAAGEPQIWEFDVSHLIWKPGSYRVICKWMNGVHGVLLDEATLVCNGLEIARDSHSGVTALSAATRDNIYELEVPPANYQRGQWQLRMKVRSQSGVPEPLDSRGLLLIEDGLAVDAEVDDFLGHWEYRHDGKVFRRSFWADGSAEIRIDGGVYQTFASGAWRVEDGCLLLTAYESDGQPVIERHLLRNRDALVFVNCPYRDAMRVIR